MRYPAMKLGIPAGLLFAAIFAVSPATLAQDDDLTLDVVESEDAGEDAVSADIMLPESAAPEAHENAAFGLETANDARKRGREFGRDRAAEARETGRDMRDAFGGVPGEGIPDVPQDRPDGAPDNLPGRP